MELIVRTSDRGKFKTCRRQWDYGSKVRQNYIPIGVGAKPLDFGTAVHAGLEAYYNPETWELGLTDKSLIETLALAAFRTEQQKQLKKYLKEINQETITDEELRADYAERAELGVGMLQNYFGYAKRHDVGWTPLFVEVEFEVPIPGLEGTLAEGAVYQGRIDLVIQDADGYIWIVDHKTAAKFDDTDHLDMDPQCGSYAWAIQHILGVPVHGVLYNELRKGVPGPPEILKSGKLSKNKQQDTSYEIYHKTLMDMFKCIPPEYNDFLDYLKNCPPYYFRRTPVTRSQAELEGVGSSITLEALDMYDPNLRIYPNPSKFNCRWCDFKAPCLAKMDGSDEQWLLDERYQKRTNNEDM